jgi:hypothetical protein
VTKVEADDDKAMTRRLNRRSFMLGARRATTFISRGSSGGVAIQVLEFAKVTFKSFDIFFDSSKPGPNVTIHGTKDMSFKGLSLYPRTRGLVFTFPIASSTISSG